MWKRFGVLLSFCGAVAWHLGWEFIRSLIYEQGSHMLTPWLEKAPIDAVIYFGPSVILVALGLYLFWLTRPRRAPASPLEIIFDPSNPRNNFWSIESKKDDNGKYRTCWEYRVLIKNTSQKTLRNAKATVEAIGPMPTRPETTTFDINKKRLMDLDPNCGAFAVLLRWYNPPIVPGMVAGGAYGPIKMTASADDVLPITKHFRFYPELMPMVSSIKDPLA